MRFFFFIAISFLWIMAGCTSQSIEDAENDECGLSPDTGLPVLCLDLSEEITDKEEWKPARIRMDSLDTDGKIKGRGNTTWTVYPKKPYSLKFDGKKWVLLANYRDRTLMRNAVAFEISRRAGLEWTPSCSFVELVINGVHKGSYLLCESVSQVVSGKSSEGSVLLEFDKYLDEEYTFVTPIRKLPVNVKRPKKISEESLRNIQDQMDSIECSLYRTCDADVEDYLDLESFANYFIVYEITGNSEIRWPKSAFIHKHAGEKWEAGPVWDFDWNPFMLPEKDELTKYENRLRNEDALWYETLLENEAFQKILRQRWEKTKSQIDNVQSYIKDLGQKLRMSDSLNSILWPIDLNILGDDVCGDELMSFDQATQSMQSVLKYNYDRLERLLK